MTALLTPLAHAFQITDVQATSFAFVYGLAYAAIAPFTGVLTAPFPRHRVALAGIAVHRRLRRLGLRRLFDGPAGRPGIDRGRCGAVHADR